MPEHIGGNMWRLTGEERLVDEWTDELKISAPTIVRLEKSVIDKVSYLRCQGVDVTVCVRAKNIYEAIQKSAERS